MDKTGKQTYVLNVERKKTIFFTISKRDRKEETATEKQNKYNCFCMLAQKCIIQKMNGRTVPFQRILASSVLIGCVIKSKLSL